MILGSAPPTIAEVDRITALTDPVIRNLQITQCYQELAVTVAQCTGLRANWCTFATWASKQAGQTIRKEDLEHALESVQDAAPATAQAVQGVAVSAQQIGAEPETAEIAKTVWEILSPAAAIDRASDAVGRGNKKVFEEIGREFARFSATCLSDTAFDAGKIAQFCAGLRPGDPPLGQRNIRQAFARYYQAFFESDAKTRLELLLLANLEIGLHEQMRLQPEIAESLDAAVVDPRDFTRRLLKALFPHRTWLVRLRLFIARLFGRQAPLDDAINVLLAAARRETHRFITEHMMTIGLPHGVRLRLGDDLRAQFPPALREIANPDLRALLAQVDPTPDSTHGSGANDWADLPQRLHFIADLFRCYAESPDLFEPPFTPEQVIQLKAGQLLIGPL